jgi:hypothetical protein
MTDDLSWIDHPANLRANAVLLRAVADQSLLHADEIERLKAENAGLQQAWNKLAREHDDLLLQIKADGERND